MNRLKEVRIAIGKKQYYAPLNFEGDAAANVRILGKAVAFISTVR